MTLITIVYVRLNFQLTRTVCGPRLGAATTTMRVRLFTNIYYNFKVHKCYFLTTSKFAELETATQLEIGASYQGKLFNIKLGKICLLIKC